MFDNRLDVRLPASTPPILLVVVDTEEEFDWNAGFDRDATQISAIEHVGRLQVLLDEYGIRPTYVVDYCIASQPAGVEALKPLLDEGRADIGAHLHGWVNPPFEEAVCARNSYQGNLPGSLERAKLGVLKDCITEGFGRAPVIHKAGRYGYGPNTTGILSELGFEIDISTTPAFDWRSDGGPDFRHLGQHAFWFGRERRLLGVPNTGGFIGTLRGFGPMVHAAPAMRSAIGTMLGRALSKSRLLERILLSPEGHTLDKMLRLTRALYGYGCRVFTLSLHSPTLKPGCTYYTPTPASLEAFLGKCRRYFECFFGELGGQALTPAELRQLALESIAGDRAEASMSPPADPARTPEAARH